MQHGKDCTGRSACCRSPRIPRPELSGNTVAYDDWIAGDGLNFSTAPTIRPTSLGKPKKQGDRYGNNHYQRWDTDLLQRLGHRTAHRIQPWLAPQRGCMGRSNDLSRCTRLSMHSA